MDLLNAEDISNDTKKLTAMLYALHSSVDELPDELMEWGLLGAMEMSMALTDKLDKIAKSAA